jgi:hypothetical protein
MILTAFLLGLLCNLVNGQQATISFYDNECYGSKIGQTYEVNADSSNQQFYDFPGGHFMSTGDGCGPDYCMVATFSNQADCVSYAYKVGTGCQNIDVGFQPYSFTFFCEKCSDLPSLGYANACF